MKKITIKCPHCQSMNTSKTQIEKTTCFDDETYNVLSKCFKNSLESTTNDNIIFKYECKDCTKQFSVMAFVNIEPTKVVIADSMQDLVYYKEDNKDSYYSSYELQKDEISE